MSNILRYNQNPLVNSGKHEAVVSAITPIYSHTSRGFYEFAFQTEAGPVLRLQVSSHFQPAKQIWKLIENILGKELPEVVEFDLDNLIGKKVWLIVNTVYEDGKVVRADVDKVYKRHVPKIYNKRGRV